MHTLLLWLDPMFIAPYRMFTHPVGAFIMGTCFWALIAAVLGLLTLGLARHMHRERLQAYADSMRHYHELGEEALRQGQKESFKNVNKQAHEAFGYHFSLLGAFFVASLWPVPLVLAWMHLRFAGLSPKLPFSLPLLGDDPGLVFWLLLFYIPLRMTCSRWLR